MGCLQRARSLLRSSKSVLDLVTLHRELIDGLTRAFFLDDVSASSSLNQPRGMRMVLKGLNLVSLFARLLRRYSRPDHICDRLDESLGWPQVIDQKFRTSVAKFAQHFDDLLRESPADACFVRFKVA